MIIGWAYAHNAKIWYLSKQKLSTSPRASCLQILYRRRVSPKPCMGFCAYAFTRRCLRCNLRLKTDKHPFHISTNIDDGSYLSVHTYRCNTRVLFQLACSLSCLCNKYSKMKLWFIELLRIWLSPLLLRVSRLESSIIQHWFNHFLDIHIWLSSLFIRRHSPVFSASKLSRCDLCSLSVRSHSLIPRGVKVPNVFPQNFDCDRDHRHLRHCMYVSQSSSRFLDFLWLERI